MAELRVLHAAATVEDEGSGIAYCVPRLCEALAANGAQVTLLSVGRPGEDRTRGYLDRRLRQDFAGVPVAGALRLSRAFGGDAAARIGATDIVHCHGLWQMPMVVAANAARRRGIPVIVAPHGMLAPAALAASRTKKALFWTVWQRRLFAGAACLHATSGREHDDIRAAGLTNPIAIVPNGVDIPAVDPPAGANSPRTLLSLSRIHPHKLLDRLIEAWTFLEPKHPDWRLRIVGPDELGHAGELRAMADRAGLQRVTIADALFGTAKLAAYNQADLFVMTSRSENFGMTVAEALAAGTPVVCVKGAPWSGLDGNGCGWWVDAAPEALAATLGRAMSLPAGELAAMGARGREWMARDFAWPPIAGQMELVYEWLLGRAAMPENVRTD